MVRFLKISNFLENDSGGAPALRVPRAVTRLTVHRSLPYGCSWQLVGCQKNVDLFVISGAFFVEVMRSFILILSICIFPGKFNKKESQGAFHLFNCSREVTRAVAGKFV